ncbi:MAG: MarC family protein [Dehalococcoidales bacterium]|nr:MarC family protein [Dehalococcoidales bacterium]
MSFIPLFVAVDAIGNLPFILSLTQGENTAERGRVIRYAMLTALALGLGFLAIGRGMLVVLGLKPADFLVAGGLILFVLTIRHFTTGKLVELQGTSGKEIIGVVPIGTPLVVGPAVLTTLLLLTPEYGIPVVSLAFVLNLGFAGLIFTQADRIARFMREPGLRAVSQIASLLLAVIAVMMVRKGLVELLS